MKFYFKYLITFLQKFHLIIILGIFFGALFFLSILYIFPNINIQKNYRIGYTGRFTIDTLPFEISSKIGQGLVSVDSSSKIFPLLAKNWTVEENGKKWIFEINSDKYWQDNKKVSIEDLNYNFVDVSISKNDNKISFELKEPYVPFIVLLEKPIFRKGLLGTGDWKVKKLSIKGEYLQSINIKKGSDTEIIKFYPTEDQTKFAFKIGEVDTITNVFSPKPFTDWKNVNISEEIKTDQVVVIFFNTQDATLSEKNLRQALNYSIDKSIYKMRAISPINPKSFYFNPQVKSYDFDITKAKQMIKDMKSEIPENFVLKLISTPNLIDTADYVSSMWRESGINSNVLVSSIIPSDYQAFITIFDMPKDPDQYSLWHSTQSETNITKYKNLRIDKLLEDGRIEENIDERKKIYLDFQRYLLEDSPAVFLYHPIWYTVSRK